MPTGYINAWTNYKLFSGILHDIVDPGVQLKIGHSEPSARRCGPAMQDGVTIHGYCH